MILFLRKRLTQRVFGKNCVAYNCTNLLPGDRDNYQSGVPAYANIPKLYHP